MHWRANDPSKLCKETHNRSVTNGGSVMWHSLEESVTLQFIDEQIPCSKSTGALLKHGAGTR